MAPPCGRRAPDGWDMLAWLSGLSTALVVLSALADDDDDDNRHYVGRCVDATLNLLLVYTFLT